MFKFLFGGKSSPVVEAETNRERFGRLVVELNELIDTLPTKPRVTFDPQSGHILPDVPEQFADEALALPSPGAGVSAAEPEPAAKPVANPAVTGGDAVAVQPRATNISESERSHSRPPEARGNGAG